MNRWTPELEAIYGLRPGEFAGTQEAWEQMIYPEDRAAAIRKVEIAFQTERSGAGGMARAVARWEYPLDSRKVAGLQGQMWSAYADGRYQY